MCRYNNILKFKLLIIFFYFKIKVTVVTGNGNKKFLTKLKMCIKLIIIK